MTENIHSNLLATSSIKLNQATYNAFNSFCDNNNLSFEKAIEYIVTEYFSEYGIHNKKKNKSKMKKLW